MWLSCSATTNVRLARRAQMVLLAAAGLDNTAIPAELNVGPVQVGRWRERYIQGGGSRPLSTTGLGAGALPAWMPPRSYASGRVCVKTQIS
ncbi:MAG: helix-turn-helix domain-containing protein [Candidimonas sp.]|nr:MAG: helix-turn-helix domain-containing protein [Candidimonas sp.]TAM24458.1 MAG: helix-turn-helix domain-containing protein [Candidimonas sp.]